MLFRSDGLLFEYLLRLVCSEIFPVYYRELKMTEKLPIATAAKMIFHYIPLKPNSLTTIITALKEIDIVCIILDAT